MRSQTLFSGNHQWTVYGRDTAKPEQIIDTNQYMIHDSGSAILLDPGGIELFASMLASVIKKVPLEQIGHLFASHQDPDIISSLGLWDQVLDKPNLYASWLWESFIPHFGMANTKYQAIKDEGEIVTIGHMKLQFLPAHYLHSSGNFNVFDAEAKILFTGDIGSALEAPGADLFVDDFDSHIPKMKVFHQRWMPSNRAKSDWISRVRRLNIDMLVPQHGRLFRGDDCARFLDWFEELEVGTAVP
ncbi:MAG: MBL fold metallo-hydrolase [Myxococcales bacterium]|nr:MBL fold metallo-hydrolase [Myxococcales bacterium]